ncbi:DgyrCDS8859 [Dimorphilus gyrociliatus]|uniref:DgyrCDS8859 n=1 Tax=Dimorphilus gyrociliatus TaxID=2664684 RepID=A0A7I8VVI4_9ANNE|nr:DgyrCDS8859 [Dimorphilus gyrociliatus]
MRSSKFGFLLILTVFVDFSNQWIIPLGIGGLLTGVAWKYLPCASVFFECCDQKWFNKNNITALTKSLEESLYGQHLVLKTVVPALKRHLTNKNPPKALVLSFHGWTGGGKNYVSRKIAESLFKKGTASKYYHLFVATLHFPHKEMNSIYKDNIQQWIKGNVSECPHQLFIFDEVDKMSAGLIDAIQPFIDFHDNVENIDYRHSIFLFLSNTGGDMINRQMVKMWRNGLTRDDIQLKDMESLIQNLAFNNKDGTGLWHSSLVERNLITALIPFLPLEKHHVKKCARDYLLSRSHTKIAYDDDFLNQIANQMTYQPKDSQLYSTSGCKRVAQHCDLLIYNHSNEDL